MKLYQVRKRYYSPDAPVVTVIEASRVTDHSYFIVNTCKSINFRNALHTDSVSTFLSMDEALDFAEVDASTKLKNAEKEVRLHQDRLLAIRNLRLRKNQ